MMFSNYLMKLSDELHRERTFPGRGCRNMQAGIVLIVDNGEYIPIK